MSGEGSGVKGAALGKVFEVVMDLFALFGFARHFSVSGLNSFFLHSQGSVNLNKNQLFFFVLPFLLPKSPWAAGTSCPGSPRDVPKTSSPPPPLAHPVCHRYTTSPLPSQNSDPTRKCQVRLKFLKTRQQKIASRASQEQNIPK